MTVISELFSAQRRLSPAGRRGWAISRRLFRDPAPAAADAAALVALGPEAVEPFRLVLERHGGRHGSARREAVVELIASAGGEKEGDETHSATVIALLGSFIGEREGLAGARAVARLVRFGPRVQGVLLKALAEGNRWCRSEAARGLGRIGGRRAIPGLIAALGDPDPRVRGESAEALGRLGDPQAEQPLFSALTDPDWLVRESASSALVRFSSDALVDKLVRFLQEDEPSIRSQAIHTLREIDTPAAREALVSALDDPDFEVVWDAVGALADPRHHPALPALLRRFPGADGALQERLLDCCRKIGPERLPPLLHHDEARIRRAAAELLGRMEQERFLPQLVAAWQTEHDREVRTWITLAVGRLVAACGERAPDEAVQLLITAAGSDHRAERYHAERLLQDLPHPLARRFRHPAGATQVAIDCPGCLEPVRLTPPLTGRRWHCPHCRLTFSIRTGADRLIVTPLVHTPRREEERRADAPWYEVLGVAPDAESETIRHAFRGLLKQYHPDRVAGLGPEFQRLAEEKTRRLTRALRAGLAARGEAEGGKPPA